MTSSGGRAEFSRFEIPLPGGRVCPVVIGPGAVALAPDRIRALPASRCAVITDSHLEATHGTSVAALLRSAGIDAHLFTFPAGEVNKTRASKESLEDRMIAAGFGRDSSVVAVGGGVTGDLAGFVAATFMRGVPYLQVPTSLLAMTDAAIGGKTAVDHPRGKNLIGAFHHPEAVIADTDFLKSLPFGELRTGLAEMIKAGVVADAGLFESIEADAPRLAAGDLATLGLHLPRAVAVKVQVVSADEREADRRQILNFGHTIGHALELESGFALSHGEAVSIGMVVESRIAARLGLLGAGDVERLQSLLSAVGLPVGPPLGSDPRRILDAARADKKACSGKVRFVLPTRIGEMARGEGGYAISVPEGDALAALGAAAGN